MEMPAPDASVIARRDEITAALRHIVPGEGVIVSEPERRAYESDGLTAYRQPPLAVVLPSSIAEVAAVLRYCRDERIKVVPRGAGTSLSGGALPLEDGVLQQAGPSRASRSEAERLAFWSGRKAAFPAVGRISPDYYCMDGAGDLLN